MKHVRLQGEDVSHFIGLLILDAWVLLLYRVRKNNYYLIMHR